MKKRILKIALLNICFISLIYLISYYLVKDISGYNFTLGGFILGFLVEVLVVLLPSVVAIAYCHIFFTISKTYAKWHLVMIINGFSIFLISIGLGIVLFQFSLTGILAINFTRSMICACIIFIILSFVYKGFYKKI